MKNADIGLIGLAVMGQNLARNIADKGYKTLVYNRTTEKTTEFISKFGTENLTGEKDLKTFVKNLKTPRKIIIMVKAGSAVDAVINQLLPHLDKNDLIIDCGNSNYLDTIRRSQELKEKKINFLGSGVSGGEEGALHGPSLMPGGNKTSYKKVEKIFQKIAAKDFSNNPCTTYIGDDGAGHYVKTIHNGIEYGVMQLMSEAYEIYRSVYKLSAPEIADIFGKYNRGKLKSYLFEISQIVLAEKDTFKKGYLIDYILDKAGQKGTGRWTAIDSLERASSTPTIIAAVNARINSGEKDLRTKLAKLYKKPSIKQKIPLQKAIPIINSALYAAMLISYAQGMSLIQKAATEQKWQIDLAEVARIWQGGCIIRAEILKTLTNAYKNTKRSPHLFEIKSISEDLKKHLPKLRQLNAFTSINGITTPALASAQHYFEAMTEENSSANLIQGLRDHFGAHTYERTDKKGSFHTEW